ncbi:hypothetical protein BCR33DRAFT_786205 [Rhizoclosmatium globosum]|uniref:Bro-N domain-containing protein n=1 Tax=Rhizoclosmatium globosum TaxID=329046 RepID=A0A1Y2C5Y6_9FUNG|nr:hypothetical protein BCR33DRAFT_786205 [Rhizoclosmatium globosum]|eukprot:ORY42458.1 hypothetical protein BCR33DRAFT_786205 [Rhizoclosmatium globosum]
MSQQLVSSIFEGVNIEVYGTLEEPLFKANYIGRLLGITNRSSQEMLMLTETGLYTLLFPLCKEIVLQFQNWICGMIKEIRLRGKYDLEEKLRVVSQSAEQREKQLTEAAEEEEKRAKQLIDASNQEKEELQKYSGTAMMGGDAKNRATSSRNSCSPGVFKQYLAEGARWRPILSQLFEAQSHQRRRLRAQLGKRRSEYRLVDRMQKTFDPGSSGSLVMGTGRRIRISRFRLQSQALVFTALFIGAFRPPEGPQQSQPTLANIKRQTDHIVKYGDRHPVLTRGPIVGYTEDEDKWGRVYLYRGKPPERRPRCDLLVKITIAELCALAKRRRKL